jgi:restriction system protein
MKNKKAEFIKWMGGILDALRELGGSGTPKEVSSKIAEIKKIPQEQLEEKLNSGSQRFHNQVCWARQYLVWEGLLESTKRGVWTLSKKGEKVKLNDKESHELFLKWVEVHAKNRKENKEKLEANNQYEDDEDIISSTSDYREKLITLLRNLHWKNFEKFSLMLLRESGFEDLKLTNPGKDEGIDGIGILKVNPFVTFKVLFQCKRYSENNSISRQKIADFRNSMLGRADKGIFITTSYFTAEAIKEASRDGAQTIELVDAEKLIDLIEEKEFGLKPIKSFEIDYDFFKQFDS